MLQKTPQVFFEYKTKSIHLKVYIITMWYTFSV